MREKLQNINDNSYNNFMIRIGVNVGPVVAGGAMTVTSSVALMWFAAAVSVVMTVVLLLKK